MRGFAIGTFVLLLLLVASSSNDLLGWEARARIERQTQIQVATIQANAQLEALRMKQAAVIEQAHIRAALMAKFLQVLPLIIGMICGTTLLGWLMHSHWKRQLTLTSSETNASPTRLTASSSMPLSPSGSLLKISARDLQNLQQQAQAANCRVDVVMRGRYYTALLIDNVTGQVRAERMFAVREAVAG